MVVASHDDDVSSTPLPSLVCPVPWPSLMGSTFQLASLRLIRRTTSHSRQWRKAEEGEAGEACRRSRQHCHLQRDRIAEGLRKDPESSARYHKVDHMSTMNARDCCAPDLRQRSRGSTLLAPFGCGMMMLPKVLTSY